MSALYHERYAFVRELGAGGQASTFEAVDSRDGRRVAVKRFRVRGAKSWKEVELAEREAMVLPSISNPAFPRYVEHFEEGGDLFLVTEMIEGESLADLLRKGGSVSEAEVVRFLREASAALDYLHGADPPIVHRDIKPSNVIRRLDGSFAFIDFGSVRHRMKPEGGSTVVGTFGYMAPEQFQGRAGPGSDVYAVAATALVLLTGREPEDLPHRGLAIDVAAALPPRRADLRLVRILEAMLEPDPDRRPTRIRPLLAKLEGDATSGGAPARAPGRREDEDPRPRRPAEIAGDLPGSIALFRGYLTTAKKPLIRPIRFNARVAIASLLTFEMAVAMREYNGYASLLLLPLAWLSILWVLKVLQRGRRYTVDVDVSSRGLLLTGLPRTPRRLVRWGSVVALRGEASDASLAGSRSEDGHLAAALKDGEVVVRLASGESMPMSLVNAFEQTAGRVVKRIRHAQARALESREGLLDVVEDAARPQEERIAAASELARDLDDRSRSRLRIAAASFAKPRIRIALEEAAGASDDTELEAALATLEPEPRERREV